MASRSRFALTLVVENYETAQILQRNIEVCVFAECTTKREIRNTTKESPLNMRGIVLFFL